MTGQYIVTDFNFLFKDNYSNVFTTKAETKLKGKRLSASYRRVLVTRSVSQAHRLSISVGNANADESFKGWVPSLLTLQRSSFGSFPLMLEFLSLMFSSMFTKGQLHRQMQCLQLILFATCQLQSAKPPSFLVSIRK